MAVLDCRAVQHGEGRDRIRNIAYWQESSADRERLRHRHPHGRPLRFATFRPDRAGWNNARMVLETVIYFALHTGRAVVLPSSMPIWHLPGVDWQDIYPTDKLNRTMEVLSLQEYMREMDHFPELISLGPSFSQQTKQALREGRLEEAHMMERVASASGRAGIPRFQANDMALLMPAESHLQGDEHSAMDTEWDPNALLDCESAKPLWSSSRLNGWVGGRERRPYTATMQNARSIFFPNENNPVRLLTHYYTFVLHPDRHVNNLMLRTMRDNLHYDEKFFCKASQVMHLLREESESGEFSTFHVRRGDFAKTFKAEQWTAEDMLNNTSAYLQENEVLYIATDEPDLSFFDPLKQRYNVRFLHDYAERAGLDGDVPSKLLWSVLDSIIAAHGRTFTGTRYSTFSGYIHRLRGFYGHPRERTWFFHKGQARPSHTSEYPHPPYWKQEWPFAWEGIDDVPPDPALSEYARIE